MRKFPEEVKKNRIYEAAMWQKVLKTFAGTYFRAADVREMVLILIFAGIYFRAKGKSHRQNAKNKKKWSKK